METVISDKVDMKEWFDNMVATIRSHELMLETGVAPVQIQQLYGIFFDANADEIHRVARGQSTIYFIRKLVVDYLNEVKSRIQNKGINKLALQLSESQILVWAEIKDDDEKAEDALLLAEAKINADYHEFGFHVSSTILEESDNYPIPEQFSNVF